MRFYVVAIMWLFIHVMANFAVAAEITVSAAASLNDVFRDIGKRYETKYPQDKVYLNFAGSGALLQQIINGAPVDVFAPADQWRMRQAIEQQLVLDHDQRPFARNALVAIVPTSDKTHYDSLQAFILSERIQAIAIANPEHVPAGRYTKQSLQSQKLWAAAQAKQIPTQNVRQALDYVARAEVDAGLVYLTDALISSDNVRQLLIVPTPEPITYPIAILKDSRQKPTAQRFVDFVLSDEGQAILEQYGFQPIDMN